MKSTTAEVGTSAAAEEEISNQLYEGRLELEIAPPVDFRQVLKLQSNLRGVPDLKVVSVGGSAQGTNTITVALNQPLPLISLLREMPLVEDAVSWGESIRVTLKPV